jgi:hypothetical protein
LYKKVLLAYDGSIEGRRALREGAKLAQFWSRAEDATSPSLPARHVVIEVQDRPKAVSLSIK